MPFAVIGPEALWLTFVWLASAIVASQFSLQKGYGEKTGLVTGVIGTLLGAFVWAVWPAREVSRWNIHEGLTGTERTTMFVILAVLGIVGIFFVVTIDASAGGKIGLAAVVIMALVIAAGLVKVVSIMQSTGGKTMAELRAEREGAL
jgi:tellurite resistance protein TehA-like permease